MVFVPFLNYSKRLTSLFVAQFHNYIAKKLVSHKIHACFRWCHIDDWEIFIHSKSSGNDVKLPLFVCVFVIQSSLYTHLSFEFCERNFLLASRRNLVGVVPVTSLHSFFRILLHKTHDIEIVHQWFFWFFVIFLIERQMVLFWSIFVILPEVSCKGHWRTKNNNRKSHCVKKFEGFAGAKSKQEDFISEEEG